MTTTTNAASLADRARAAWEASVATASATLAEDRNAQISRIHEALAVLGFEAAGDAFINPASKRPCVPLIVGGITTEESDGKEYPVFTHTVAAEADPGDDTALLLVADREPEGDYTDRWLYPAGRLNGIVDIGIAIEHGGYSGDDLRPQTARDLVGSAIRDAYSAAGNTAGYQTVAVVHAANAICTALLDVAAAIRKTAGA